MADAAPEAQVVRFKRGLTPRFFVRIDPALARLSRADGFPVATPASP